MPPRWYTFMIQAGLLVGAFAGWSVLIAMWATNFADFHFEEDEIAVGYLDAGVTIFVGALGLLAALFAAAVAWTGVQRQIHLQALHTEREDARHERDRIARMEAYSTELVGEIISATTQVDILGLQIVQGRKSLTRRTLADEISSAFTTSGTINEDGWLRVDAERFYNRAALREIRTHVFDVLSRLPNFRDDAGDDNVEPADREFENLRGALMRLGGVCYRYNFTVMVGASREELDEYIGSLTHKIRKHLAS